jgi:hypothetical protein
MKALLRALALTIALAASTFAQSVQGTQPTLHTDLGDGFDATESSLTIEGQKYLTTDVTFPKWMTDDEHFSTGMRLALIKVFGCDSFPACEPEFTVVNEQGGVPPHTVIKLDGEWRVHVFYLLDNSKDKNYIGISFITIR